MKNISGKTKSSLINKSKPKIIPGPYENKIQLNRPLQSSLEQLHLNLQSNMNIRQSKIQLQESVPIIRIAKSTSKLNLANLQSSFIAFGDLKGVFYQSQSLEYINDIYFQGKFTGTFERVQNQFYFEGTIQNFNLVRFQDNHQLDDHESLIFLNQTTYKGFFKGKFIKNCIQNSQQIERDDWSILQKQIQNKPVHQNYLLPTSVHFQIKDIREINLEKSMAKVHANIFIDIQYNQTIQKLLELDHNRDKEITLEFNRDFNLKLPISQGSEEYSSDSEWSLQDRTWDIHFRKDKQKRVLHYRVWKAFKTQIDNSYGSFFAPFNLSILRLVINFHNLILQDEEENNFIELSLNCVDINEFEKDQQYNPFCKFNQLKVVQNSNQSPLKNHMNRIRKINRSLCTDIGEYMIADNQLLLFPYFKNILLNKNKAHQSYKWNLGLADKLQFFQKPYALSIVDEYNQTKKSQDKNSSAQNFEMFQQKKWQYVHIEIPIYKYIVIDMIKVFVPLTILSIISLLIFNQQNGIGIDSKFTTLAYRLVNIATVMIAYVSLIPIIRQNLPPMPEVTLIEIITYIQTIPNLLAIWNSMVYYQQKLTSWQANYYVFKDGVFLFAFIITSLNFVILITAFIVYKKADYNMKLPKLLQSKINVESSTRSPDFLKYINQIKENRKQFTIKIQK